MRLRPPSTLAAALLALALAALGAAAGDEPAARRLLLVFLGEPGLAVEIEGASGEIVAASCNEEGLLRVYQVAAVGEVLRFRTPDPKWRLAVERKVPAGDPEIPVYWDLAAQLRPRSFSPSPSPAPPPPAPPPPPPDPRPEPEADPCREKRSLVCRLERWSRFETAVAERDCAAALPAAERLMEEYPDFAAAGTTRRAFGEVYLDCGLAADGDLRRERLARALGLLPDGGGAAWCEAVDSRLLAAAFADAGPAVAAAAAAGARKLCPEATPPLEWEFYFRLQGGETGAAAALVAETPRRIALFFEAWLARTRQSCVDAAGNEIVVELEASGDLPCRGLPQEICALPYAEHLLACGNGPEDAATAALFLRSTLPADPTAWRLGVPEERDTVELLAEAEWAAGRFDEAARLAGTLADTASNAEDEGRHHRRRAKALLMKSENDPADAAAAEEALAAWAALQERQESGGDAVSRALTLNNLAVLRARLGQGPSQGELAALEEAVDALPEDATDLRLVLRGHLLALAIGVLERTPAHDARGQLERLRILRGAFVEHEAELRAAPPAPHRPGWVLAVPGAAETPHETPDEADDDTEDPP